MTRPRPADVVFWSPPEDHDKPTLPYLPSFNIAIFLHQIAGTEQPRPYLETEYLPKVTQSEAVVNNPTQFACLPSVDRDMAHLEINAPITIGAAQGPQIVACYNQSMPERWRDPDIWRFSRTV